MVEVIETNNWLDILQSQLAEISEKDLIEPDDSVGKNDTVIGQMTEWQKRLYTYRERLKREGYEVNGQYQFARKDQKVNYRARLHEISTKYKLVNALLWLDIREQNWQWESEIGIRENWTIVETRDDSEGIEEFFRHLFG
jgi:hypothetical protein